MAFCPRHWYIDAEFKCPRCGKEFTGQRESKRRGLRNTSYLSMRSLVIAGTVG